MSRFKNEVAHLQAHIKTLRMGAVALLLLALVMGGWAAAGSVDTDLSFLSSLELYGTEIAERRMPTRRVVEALDVIEHV